MIYDSISCFTSYFKVNKAWEKVFAFIDTLPVNAAIGRTGIDGDEIYASIFSYVPASEKDAAFEAHRKYIDIQVILEGHENIHSFNTEGCLVKTEYDPTKDFLLYEAPDFPVAELPMAPGRFAVFYPHDAHKPGIRCSSCALVKKLVVKVDVSLL